MRIAFIGAGGIATRHAEALAKLPEVSFVGAYDATADRAEAFAARHGGAAYRDIAGLLDDGRPDAVWICLPPFAHGEAEQAVLQRRLPFLVEKPISNSLDVARRILDQVARTGVPAAAGYMNRYRRGVARAKELLTQDPAMLAHGGWVGGTPGVAWWRVKEQSGGQIVEQTTHTFDLVRYLVGEPTTVHAWGASGRVTDLPGYDVEDASTVAVAFESGAVGSLVSCCGCAVGGEVHLTIAARRHYVRFSGWNHDTEIVKSPIEREHIAGETDVFGLEDAAFLRAVETGDTSRILSPYDDAVRTLAFCLAANRSLETGAPVEVPSL